MTIFSIPNITPILPHRTCSFTSYSWPRFCSWASRTRRATPASGTTVSGWSSFFHLLYLHLVFQLWAERLYPHRAGSQGQGGAGEVGSSLSWFSSWHHDLFLSWQITKPHPSDPPHLSDVPRPQPPLPLRAGMRRKNLLGRNIQLKNSDPCGDVIHDMT